MYYLLLFVYSEFHETFTFLTKIRKSSYNKINYAFTSKSALLVIVNTFFNKLIKMYLNIMENITNKLME